MRAMLKAMMAGLLSMTALVPLALAQDGRSMDRGTWRRERAERPSPSPQQAAPVERPAAPPRDGVPPQRWDRGGAGRPAPQPRGWQERRDDPRAGAQPGDRAGRGDDRPDRPRRDWQERRDDLRGAGRDGGRDGERDGERGWDRGVPRPPVAGGGWDRGPDRRDDARSGGDRVWRSDRAEPRQRFGGYDRPAPPSVAWRSGRSAGWDRDWRRDPRYDWSRYRNERRSAFRLPRYYAPYGWNGGYRRFGVGVPLSPMLYTPRYWIYDPYAYRLPDAEEPYRWVRYYDDALLVDIEDGTVVDVIHGIFA
jgi:hypothetical protein